ncbi:MAG: hypothetical protein ACXVGO_02110, partial [Mycobacterium sp.]
ANRTAEKPAKSDQTRTFDGSARPSSLSSTSPAAEIDVTSSRFPLSQPWQAIGDELGAEHKEPARPSRHRCAGEPVLHLVQRWVLASSPPSK